MPFFFGLDELDGLVLEACFDSDFLESLTNVSLKRGCDIAFHFSEETSKDDRFDSVSCVKNMFPFQRNDILIDGES